MSKPKHAAKISITQQIVYCPYCQGAHPLRYKKTWYGWVKVKTRCCGRMLGLYQFPEGMTRSQRRGLLAYLNM